MYPSGNVARDSYIGAEMSRHRIIYPNFAFLICLVKKHVMKKRDISKLIIMVL